MTIPTNFSKVFVPCIFYFLWLKSESKNQDNDFYTNHVELYVNFYTIYIKIYQKSKKTGQISQRNFFKVSRKNKRTDLFENGWSGSTDANTYVYIFCIYLKVVNILDRVVNVQESSVYLCRVVHTTIMYVCMNGCMFQCMYLYTFEVATHKHKGFIR